MNTYTLSKDEIKAMLDYMCRLIADKEAFSPDRAVLWGKEFDGKVLATIGVKP